MTLRVGRTGRCRPRTSGRRRSGGPRSFTPSVRATTGIGPLQRAVVEAGVDPDGDRDNSAAPKPESRIDAWLVVEVARTVSRAPRAGELRSYFAYPGADPEPGRGSLAGIGRLDPQHDDLSPFGRV